MKALDLKGTLVAFEITLDTIPLPKYRPTKVKPALALSDFQRSRATSPSWWGATWRRATW